MVNPSSYQILKQGGVEKQKQKSTLNKSHQYISCEYQAYTRETQTSIGSPRKYELSGLVGCQHCYMKSKRRAENGMDVAFTWDHFALLGLF